MVFLGDLKPDEKDEFISNGQARFTETLELAINDPVFNLVVGNTPSPGNVAATIAKTVLNFKESDSYKLFADKLCHWLLSLVNMDTPTSEERQEQCKKYLTISMNAENRNDWELFLKKVNVQNSTRKGSDILFQFLIFKSYEKALIWKNSLQKISYSVSPSSLSFTENEEKVLRYVAGYIPFSLKKKYWSRKQTHVGKTVLSMINLWIVKGDEIKEDASLYEYSLSWTEKINRGGLMVVNESFYSFIKHIESVARSVLNKSLLITYAGEDLRDVLLKKFLRNQYIDKSWCSLTRNVESDALRNSIKIAILKKWIGIRARSFVNAWIQLVKRRSSTRKSGLSDKSEPSLRKSLYRS